MRLSPKNFGDLNVKIFFLSLLELSLTVQAANTSETYFIERSVQQNADLKFISHQGDGRFASYLSMEVQYAPIKKVFEQLQNKTQLKLKNRGEAHITVVTPIEYFDVLKSHLTMNEIDKIAQSLNIQAANFEVKCLGRGQVTSRDLHESDGIIKNESSCVSDIVYNPSK
jgi:hypothetical protein